MITLHLIRGPDPKGVYLRLPASPDAESRAFGKLDEISTDVGTTRIAGVTSRVRNLSQYINSADINTDYEKLKLLAERLNSMSERERHIFSGTLDAESVNGLDDVLRIADGVENYELIEDVICDRDLGGWLVEHDMLGVNFPEAVRPYLDYVGIGAAYYSDHGGAYTLNGYVKRKEVSPKQAPEQAAEQATEEQAIFTAELSAGKNSEHFAFPASDEQLDRVKEKLAVEDFCGVVVFGINIRPDMGQVMELVPKDSVTVEDLNEMAICLQEMAQTEGELLKYCSALEVEKPPTFREAVTIAMDIDDYERVTEDTEEYGKAALRRIGADEEVIDAINGYMDFTQLGEDSMEEDGVRLTKFGMVRRLSKPFPTEQKMGQAMS